MFLLSTYEIWKVLVSLAKKKFFVANFHVLGLFIPKKSDAQVGRVNTFHAHIANYIRKRPLTFRFCTEGPLRFPNF
jgi:hypothetical protein